ncbi:hypothetical protein [Mycolicibacterium septicum]|uniref:hypothetical protein n=1 Tax=Mycolicibacterium septicum TaxID=98668 RepID=UPI002E2AFC31|nr:hypothetical protein [Mycolicibacterium septicum]
MADEQQKSAVLTAAADGIGHRLTLAWVAIAGAADIDQWDEAVSKDDLVDYHLWLAHGLDARTST